MKWIPASHGLIPEGYTAIQGGYEASGEQLFHAVAKIEGYWVPGKTARHLAGANFPFHHSERYLVNPPSSDPCVIAIDTDDIVLS